MDAPPKMSIKKRPLIIISMIIVGMLTLFPVVKNHMKESLNKENYVALGDSITTGYGLEDENQSFPGLLAVSMDKTENYYNYAVNGNTSGDLLLKLSEEQVIESVRDAELITVTIGGNDILSLFRTFKEILNVEFLVSIKDVAEVINNPVVLTAIAAAVKDADLETPYQDMLNNFEKNLKLIMGKIKEINPDVRIIVQTVYNPIGGIEELRVIEPLVDTIISGINQIIENHAEESNYELVNTYDLFYNYSSEYTNINRMDIHPSLKGHHIIYEAILKEIEE